MLDSIFGIYLAYITDIFRTMAFIVLTRSVCPSLSLSQLLVRSFEHPVAGQRSASVRLVQRALASNQVVC